MKYIVKKDVVLFNSLHLVKDTIWEQRLPRESDCDSILLTRCSITISITQEELEEYFTKC